MAKTAHRLIVIGGEEGLWEDGTGTRSLELDVSSN